LERVGDEGRRVAVAHRIERRVVSVVLADDETLQPPSVAPLAHNVSTTA
jgi:hypothetical protein